MACAASSGIEPHMLVRSGRAKPMPNDVVSPNLQWVASVPASFKACHVQLALRCEHSSHLVSTCLVCMTHQYIYVGTAAHSVIGQIIHSSIHLQPQQALPVLSETD